MKAANIILVGLVVLVVISLTNTSKDVFRQEKQSNPISKNELNKLMKVDGVQATSIPQQFVDSCRQFIGTPHQYGGLSTNGIDCSGLLYINFKSFGLTIPRNSALQAAYFETVDFEETKGGDLLFFGSSEESISHAGVVTEVDSLNNIRFIHTSSSQGVIEENLKTDYWIRKLIKVGRPNYESAEIAG